MKKHLLLFWLLPFGLFFLPDQKGEDAPAKEQPAQETEFIEFEVDSSLDKTKQPSRLWVPPGEES